MLLALRLSTIVARIRAFIDIVARPYRPEQHYMRGPGPKWRARHGRAGWKS